MGVTLRYPYEIRKEEDYFDKIPDEKIPSDMLRCRSPARPAARRINWRSKDAWISNHNGAVETITLEKARHEIERLRSDNRDLARMLAAAREQLEYQ
jgi:hypothetical protein